MTPTEYKAALDELGFSQAGLARLMSAAAPHSPPVSKSTVHRYGLPENNPHHLPVPPGLCLALQDRLRLHHAGLHWRD